MHLYVISDSTFALGGKHRSIPYCILVSNWTFSVKSSFCYIKSYAYTCGRWDNLLWLFFSIGSYLISHMCRCRSLKRKMDWRAKFKCPSTVTLSIFLLKVQLWFRESPVGVAATLLYANPALLSAKLVWNQCGLHTALWTMLSVLSEKDSVSFRTVAIVKGKLVNWDPNSIPHSLKPAGRCIIKLLVSTHTEKNKLVMVPSWSKLVRAALWNANPSIHWLLFLQHLQGDRLCGHHDVFISRALSLWLFTSIY